MKTLQRDLPPWVFLLSALLGQFFLSLKGNPLTLLPAFLFFGLAVWGLKQRWSQPPGKTASFPPRLEVLALAGIFLTAAWFRVFRIDVLPCGVSVDQAVPGLAGLEVLDGWRPLFETPILSFPSLVFYLAAAWFKFFPPTQTCLALFCAALSMACLPFVYWTFRQLSGPGPALLALGFLAVARWDAFLDRWAAVNILPGFFIFATLALWLYALSSSKTWAYLISGLFLGLGLYGYYSYRVFPMVLAALAFWEIRNNPKAFRRDRFKWVGMFLVFTLLISPLLWHWAHIPGFGQGHAEDEFIGRQVVDQGSPMPIIRNTLSFLGDFNRDGDAYPKGNYGSTPLLDFVTGALAVLGLALAFWKRKGRSFIYPLFLFAGLSLNNVLCLTPTNLCHALPDLPWLAFWAGSAAWGLGLPGKGRMGPGDWALPGAALLLAGALNYHQLFDLQAANKDNAQVFDLGPTLAGKMIAREGADYDFVLRPRLALHWTIRFLDYFHPKDFKSWDWPRDLALCEVSPGKKGVYFVMEEGEEGIFKFLKSLYPGSKDEIIRDPQGFPLLYTLCVSGDAISAAHGLKGVFPGGKEKDFHYFPQGLPRGKLKADFSGSFFITRSGLENFGTTAVDRINWTIDGWKIAERQPLYLERGFHALKIHLESTKASQIHLWLWDLAGNRQELDESRLTTLPMGRGLRATYWAGQIGQGPVSSQWDPLVNFTNRTHLARFDPPLLVCWTGEIRVPEEGSYGFIALTEPTDQAQVKLDGKALTPPSPIPSGEVLLKKGWHRLELDFRMGSDYASAISLAWKKPGEGRYEIIPPEAFGSVEPLTDEESGVIVPNEGNPATP